MQPVGPAAVTSEGKGTQLRKIMKMTGQNTHLATNFSEIIQYCEKNPTRSNQLSGQVLMSQPWYAANRALCFQDAISWLKGRSHLLRFMHNYQLWSWRNLQWLYQWVTCIQAIKSCLLRNDFQSHISGPGILNQKGQTTAEIHEQILYLHFSVYVFRIC